MLIYKYFSVSIEDVMNAYVPTGFMPTPVANNE